MSNKYQDIFGIKAPLKAKRLTPTQLKRKQKKDTEDYLKRVYKMLREEGYSASYARNYINKKRKILNE